MAGHDVPRASIGVETDGDPDPSTLLGSTATGAPPPTVPRGSRRPFWHELPVLVVIALALALIVKTFLVQAFSIPTGSMEPTLVPGDRVLVNKIAYRVGDVGRGDVVVFRDPSYREPDRSALGAVVHWIAQGIGFSLPKSEFLIKRVIGLPGDRVEIRSHVVLVNGQPLTEPYLTDAARASMIDYGPVDVPNDRLFVLGDNRGHSGDSRVIGFIPRHDVVGRAFAIVWPPPDVGGLGGLA